MISVEHITTGGVVTQKWPKSAGTLSSYTAAVAESITHHDYKSNDANCSSLPDSQCLSRPPANGT